MNFRAIAPGLPFAAVLGFTAASLVTRAHGDSRESPDAVAPPVEARATTTTEATTPLPVVSAPVARDTELGRLQITPSRRVLAQAPTESEWDAEGTALPLPHASRCVAAVLGAWLRLECESRLGVGHGIAELAGSHAGVSIRPSENGLARVIVPLARGDRRFFQLDEVKVGESFAGYSGDDGEEREVVPSVNVSVVWLEEEAAPRIVIRDV
ncbi:hypothetical protein BH09MYX1_BH09MYX1_19360 [soil metagenome]